MTILDSARRRADLADGSAYRSPADPGHSHAMTTSLPPVPFAALAEQRARATRALVHRREAARRAAALAALVLPPPRRA